LVAGGLVAGLGEGPIRPALEAARRENRELRARQEVLREQALDLARRASREVKRGRQRAWLAGLPDRSWEGPGPNPPPPEAGDEALLDWLSEQSLRLEARARARASEPSMTL
jgi:hypothetical protein